MWCTTSFECRRSSQQEIPILAAGLTAGRCDSALLSLGGLASRQPQVLQGWPDDVGPVAIARRDLMCRHLGIDSHRHGSSREPRVASLLVCIRPRRPLRHAVLARARSVPANSIAGRITPAIWFSARSAASRAIASFRTGRSRESANTAAKSLYDSRSSSARAA